VSARADRFGSSARAGTVGVKMRVGLALAVAGFAGWALGAAEAEPFLAGADFSHLKFFEDRGVVYRDGGTPRDALAILTNRGLNCVRLRLFTSSAAQAAADPYNYINNLDYTLPLARRVKAAGLRLLLDFHYSDTWADPGHQRVPVAWTNLTFTQLVAQMRAYNSNVIATLTAAGAAPDYVQIGNEITQGILWPHGRVGGSYDTSNQWSQLAQLLSAAIQGVRDAAPAAPRIIIHIDRGGDWAGAQWFFDRLNARAVAYDWIGLSYYPFWHGPLSNLQTTLSNAAARYGKPVLVMETAFPFANSTNIYGFPATTNGQVQFLIALAQIVKSVPGGRGQGIFWWGAEYQQLWGYNLAGFDQRSFFGPDGSALPVVSALGRLTAPTAIAATLAPPNLRLEWPLSGAGLSLVGTTSLAPGSVWQPVAASVEQTNLDYRATVPIEGDRRFFKLRSD
jgi:arabinogalactan endo-1,4-beta-galactosidase